MVSVVSITLIFCEKVGNTGSRPVRPQIIERHSIDQEGTKGDKTLNVRLGKEGRAVLEGTRLLQPGGGGFLQDAAADVGRNASAIEAQQGVAQK